MSDETIDSALSQIPGLKDSLAQRGPAPKAEDYLSESESEEDPLSAPPPKVEDSDAVKAAMEQIPGLRNP
jgi:hypothetical protein